jgi:hypothetical protein
VHYLGLLGCKCHYDNRFRTAIKGTLGRCRAFYMDVLHCWISHTRIVGFHGTLNLMFCRLENRSSAVSTLFLESVVSRSLTYFFFLLVHSWMHHYIAACLGVSVQRTHSVHRASYESFLELDQRIRSFPVPSYLHSPVYGTERRDWDIIPSRAMRQYFAPCSVESSE